MYECVTTLPLHTPGTDSFGNRITTTNDQLTSGTPSVLMPILLLCLSFGCHGVRSRKSLTTEEGVAVTTPIDWQMHFHCHSLWGIRGTRNKVFISFSRMHSDIDKGDECILNHNQSCVRCRHFVVCCSLWSEGFL